MTKILDILKEFLKEMEKSNPYNLIAKGGTALSVYYLDHHRESEDLDFDTNLDKKYYKEIENYFLEILENLKEMGILKDYSKEKSGLAGTNRYHMKLQLESYKIFNTKIDVDFVKPVKKLNKKGKLFIYSLEDTLITKMIAFINRREFKDIYDISHILPKINIKILDNYPNIIELLNNLIIMIQNEDMLSLYKKAFRNVDLRFRDLKEPNINKFISKMTRDLRILKNQLDIKGK